MHPRPGVDYDSDSDDESLDEVETTVLLGVPDGPIESQADIVDAAVSRVGGHPVRCFACIDSARVPNFLVFSEYNATY